MRKRFAQALGLAILSVVSFLGTSLDAEVLWNDQQPSLFGTGSRPVRPVRLYGARKMADIG